MTRNSHENGVTKNGDGDRVNQQRYRVDTGIIIDNVTGDILSPTKAKNRLNQYETKINELQKQPKNNRLAEKDELLGKTLQVNNNLTQQIAIRDKEIQNIKNTIKTMMENERTRLGYNALKQAYEAIK